MPHYKKNLRSFYKRRQAIGLVKPSLKESYGNETRYDCFQ